MNIFAKYTPRRSPEDGAGNAAGAGNAGGAGAAGQAGPAGQDAGGADKAKAAGAGAGAGAANGQTWYSSAGLDPAANTLFATKGWKGWQDVANSYQELEKAIGAKGAILPGEKADDAAWQKFHSQLPGYPKDAKEYKFSDPEGTQVSELATRYRGHMAPAFHKAGLTQRQVDILLGADREFAGAIGKEREAAAAEARAKGEGEIADWRKAFGSEKAAEEAVALARDATRRILPPNSPLLGKLDELLGSGAFVDLMHRVGKTISEGGAALQADPTFGFIGSKAQAQAELNAMKANKDIQKLLTGSNKSDPQYKPTLDKWNRLHEAIGRFEQQEGRG